MSRFFFYILLISTSSILSFSRMIKGKAGEKTTQNSLFNVSLLIVHCRLRDIVILTIHLYLHVSHNNNINNINNNRNCIVLLQIYRCAACVSVYVYAVLSSSLLYKNVGGERGG